MFDPIQMITLVSVLLIMVFSGVHIAVSLGITSMLGIYLMTGQVDTVLSFASNTAYEALRDYIFAVIPLFMLMGEFLAKSGAATDLFALINRTYPSELNKKITQQGFRGELLKAVYERLDLIK